jgi:hypothetical protein
MQLERVRPGVFQATLHAMELSALIAAARLVVEEESHLPAEATQQLTEVVKSYDDAVIRLNREPPGPRSPSTGPA